MTREEALRNFEQVTGHPFQETPAWTAFFALPQNAPAKEKLSALKTIVDEAAHVPALNPWEKDVLRDAMEYSLANGGKRLRGVLVLSACQMGGGNPLLALPFAVAIEMIHAYSLIHDDLPALDNDTLRRGKPTNHVVFGEDMAIIAGDALQTQAFVLMSQSPAPRALDALRILAQAAGGAGMAGGQALDLRSGAPLSGMEAVLAIHQNKTAALITAAVEMGLTLAQVTQSEQSAGREYGQHLGLAFQIVDDLLDIEGDAALLGKSIGKDAIEDKLTWPACVGIEQARKDAARHIDQAVAALDVFGTRAQFLQELAQSTLHRVS